MDTIKDKERIGKQIRKEYGQILDESIAESNEMLETWEKKLGCVPMMGAPLEYRKAQKEVDQRCWEKIRALQAKARDLGLEDEDI